MRTPILKCEIEVLTSVKNQFEVFWAVTPRSVVVEDLGIKFRILN